MKEATQSGRKGLFIPPQAGSGIAGTLGAVVVLVFGVVFLTGLSLDRSQTAMVRFLAEKGVAILSALEGGVRSGARSRGGVRFQYLIEEVAARPDVRFIAVVMPDGTILAHSDPRRLGGVLFAEEGREFRPEELAALHPTETPSWAIVDMEGAPSFVVYKAFQPRSRHKEKKGTAFASGGEPCVFLGLDLAPLEAAQARDRKRALLIGGGVLLAGMMALLGLHALDRVRASRRGQRAAEALADKLAVTLPDGLVLLDARGRVVQLNNAALRLHGVDLDALKRANGLKGDSIRLGQRLAVPGGAPAGKTVAASSSGKSKKSAASDRGAKKGNGRIVRYEVREGDSLWAIARKFNVSPTDLLELNNMDRNSRLKPGDTVRVAVK